MRDRDRQCVGRIGLQLRRDVQKYTDHVLDLLLAGTTAADDRLLDLLGRVFGDRQTTVHGAEIRGATRLAELGAESGLRASSARSRLRSADARQ